MPQGKIIPTNAILYAGQPVVQELEVKTTTQFCPGKFVVNDTNEWCCKAATDGDDHVIGVSDVPSDKKVSDYISESAAGTVTEAFTAADQIRVLSGDIIVRVMALSGETIEVGDRVGSAANGLAKASTTAGDICGYAVTDVDISASCKWILVKLTI